MDIIWEELTSGLPDARQLTHVLIRLTAATILGAVVGYERERARKPAGLRTTRWSRPAPPSSSWHAQVRGCLPMDCRVLSRDS